MSIERPVCIYPQYYCCPGNKNCRLYHICSQLPKKNKKPFVPDVPTTLKAYRVIRPVPLDKAEWRKRHYQYSFYNRLWGDLKKYERDYFEKNHEYKMEYQRQYREKKNPNKYNYDSVLYEGLCDKDCENCKYEDCILPIWSNTKEYQALYRQKNRDKQKRYDKEYYQKNKKARLEYQKKYQKEHYKSKRELERIAKENKQCEN